MFARRIAGCVVILVGICASHALALPVHVSFDWPIDTPQSTRVPVHINAVQTGGPNAGAAQVKTEAGPDGVLLNLGDGVWQMQASAPGYWSQPSEVLVAREPVSVHITLWRAASLHGEIKTDGEMLPESLEIRLTSMPSPSRKPDVAHPLLTRESYSTPTHAELHCHIKVGRWSCLGPAGVFDVRIEAAGYAPRYEWGVDLNAARSTDFGRTELRRTASVFGQVVRSGGLGTSSSCRGVIEPDMARRGPADPEHERGSASGSETSSSVSLNARGYFQVVGVPPGLYVLEVECPGASGFRKLRVESETETRIDPPLILEELTLDVSVTPRADPAGQPWKLAIYETAPHYLLIADGASTSSEGRWIRRGLMAGNYHLVVRSSDGTAWLQKYFDLDRRTLPLTLNLGSVAVAGRVKLNSQPIRTRLLFTNNAGGETATLVSDDNGQFQGTLPLAHGLDASNWTVEAHLVQPPVTQRLLGVNVRPTAGGATWLDLDLPAIPVSGTVVSPDGKPQRDAEVTFEDSDGNRTTTGTDSEGRFEMLNLSAGKYSVAAASHDGSSDRIPFEVTKNGGSDLQIVLTPFKRYSFRVLSNQGPVEGAAVQVWIKPGMPRAFARSNQDGEFDVTLPPGTTEVGLTVGAPGYALKMIRVSISTEDNEPSNAKTITLDDSAGSLALTFQPPGHTLDASGTLYLVHNGAIQEALTLATWGNAQPGATSTATATINAIEPGAYALCLVTNPAQLAGLWSGPLPSATCRTGSVADGETLTLSPR